MPARLKPADYFMGEDGRGEIWTARAKRLNPCAAGSPTPLLRWLSGRACVGWDTPRHCLDALTLGRMVGRTKRGESGTKQRGKKCNIKRTQHLQVLRRDSREELGDAGAFPAKGKKRQDYPAFPFLSETAML